MAEAFEHTITLHPDLVEVRVRGRLSADLSERYLVEVGEACEKIASGPGRGTCNLVFVDELDWFEAGGAARSHGKWFWSHRGLVGRVGIVSQKPAMPMAASIAILISRKEIKVFTERAEAVTWARGLS